MKKIRNFTATLVGVFAIALIVGLNARHALNDYGMRDNKLHTEVLAQAKDTSKSTSNGAGSSGGNSSGNTSGNTSGNSSGNTSGNSSGNNSGGFSLGVTGTTSGNNASIKGSLIYTVPISRNTNLAVAASCDITKNGTCSASISFTIKFK